MCQQNPQPQIGRSCGEKYREKEYLWQLVTKKPPGIIFKVNSMYSIQTTFVSNDWTQE